MSSSYDPGLLDRILNPTLGVIQQPLWRIWRSMKEDDIDLWSQKGLLDPHLLPLAGVFFDPKNTVMPDELFGDNFGAQLGMSILTDPLSFLTSGATAGAKLSNALTKNFGGKNLSKAALKKASKDKAAWEARKKLAQEAGEDFTEELVDTSGKQGLYRAAAYATGDLKGMEGYGQVGEDLFKDLANRTKLGDLQNSLEKIIKDKGKLFDPDGKQIGEALDDFELDSVRKLMEDLGGAADATSIKSLADNSLLDILGMHKQREMGRGIPLLGDFFGMYVPVNAEFQKAHGNWLKWYMTRTKQFYKIMPGMPVKIAGKFVIDPIASNLPGLRHAYGGLRQMMGDFADGYKSGDLPESMVEILEGRKNIDEYKGNFGNRDVHLGALATSIREKLSIDVDNIMVGVSRSGLKANDHVATWLDQLDTTAHKGDYFETFKSKFNEDEWEDVVEYLGLNTELKGEAQIAALQDSLETALNNIGDAHLDFANKSDIKFDHKYKGSKKPFAYQAGEGLKKMQTFIFRSDLGIRQGKEVQTMLNNWKAASSQYTMQTAEDLYSAMAQVVKDTGMDPEVVSQLHSAYIGLAPLQQELDIFFKEFANPYKPVAQLMQEWQEFFGGRVNSHLETLLGVASEQLGLKGGQLDAFQKIVDTLSYNRKSIPLSEISDLTSAIPQLSKLSKHTDEQGFIAISKVRQVLAESEHALGATQYQSILKRLNLQEHQLYHTDNNPFFAILEGQGVRLDEAGVFSTAVSAADPERLMFTSNTIFKGRNITNSPLASFEETDLFGKKGVQSVLKDDLKQVKDALSADKIKLNKRLKTLLETEETDPKILKQRLEWAKQQLEADLEGLKRMRAKKSLWEEYKATPRQALKTEQLENTLIQKLVRIGTKDGKDLTLDELLTMAPSMEKGATRLSETMNLHQQIMAKQAMIEKWRDLHGTAPMGSGLTGQGIPRALLDSLKEDIEQLRIHMKDLVATTLNTADSNAGTKLIDLMDSVRNESLMIGINNGILGTSLPLGYMHRVLSGKEQDVIRKALGSISPEISQKLAGTNALRILETRTDRALTISDINEVHAYFTGLDQSHKSVKDILEVVEDLREQMIGTRKNVKYSSDPIAGVVAHISELQKVITERRWYRFVTSVEGNKMGIFGGRVVRVTENHQGKGKFKFADETRPELVNIDGKVTTVGEATDEATRLRDWLKGTTFTDPTLKGKIDKVKLNIANLFKAPGQLTRDTGVKLVDEAIEDLSFILSADNVPSLLRDKTRALKEALEEFQTNPPEIDDLRAGLKDLLDDVEDIVKPKKPEAKKFIERQIKEIEEGIAVAKESGDIEVRRSALPQRISSLFDNAAAKANAVKILNQLEDNAGPNQLDFDLLVPKNYWVVDSQFYGEDFIEFEGARRARKLLKSLYESEEMDEVGILMLREAFKFNPKHLAKIGRLETNHLAMDSRAAQLARSREEWGRIFRVKRGERYMDNWGTEASAPIRLEEGGTKINKDKDGNFESLSRSTDETGGAVFRDSGRDATKSHDLHERDLDGNILGDHVPITMGQFVKEIKQEMLDRISKNPADAAQIRKDYAPFLDEARRRQVRAFAGQIGEIALTGLDEGAHMRHTHGALLDDMGEEKLAAFIEKHFDVDGAEEALEAARDSESFIRTVMSNVITGKGVEEMEEVGLGKFVTKLREAVFKIIDFVTSQLGFKSRGIQPNRELVEQINSLARGVLDIDGDTELSYRLVYRAKRRIAEFNHEYWTATHARLTDDFIHEPVEFSLDKAAGQLKLQERLLAIANAKRNTEIFGLHQQIMTSGVNAAKTAQSRLRAIAEAEDVPFFAHDKFERDRLLSPEEVDLDQINRFLSDPIDAADSVDELLDAQRAGGTSPHDLKDMRKGIEDPAYLRDMSPQRRKILHNLAVGVTGRESRISKFLDPDDPSIQSMYGPKEPLEPGMGADGSPLLEDFSLAGLTDKEIREFFTEHVHGLEKQTKGGGSVFASDLETFAGEQLIGTVGYPDEIIGDLRSLDTQLQILEEGDDAGKYIRKFGLRTTAGYQQHYDNMHQKIRDIQIEMEQIVRDIRDRGGRVSINEKKKLINGKVRISKAQKDLRESWAKETAKMKQAMDLYKVEVYHDFAKAHVKFLEHSSNALTTMVKAFKKDRTLVETVVKRKLLRDKKLGIPNMKILQTELMDEADWLTENELLDLQKKLAKPHIALLPSERKFVDMVMSQEANGIHLDVESGDHFVGLIAENPESLFAMEMVAAEQILSIVTENLAKYRGMSDSLGSLAKNTDKTGKLDVNKLHETLSGFVPESVQGSKAVNTTKALLEKLKSEGHYVDDLAEMVFENGEINAAARVPSVHDQQYMNRVVRHVNDFFGEIIGESETAARLVFDDLADDLIKADDIIKQPRSVKSVEKAVAELEKEIEGLDDLKKAHKKYQADMDAVDDLGRKAYEDWEADFNGNFPQSSWDYGKGPWKAAFKDKDLTLDYLVQEKNRINALKANAKKINNVKAVEAYETAIKKVNAKISDKQNKIRKSIRRNKAKVFKAHKATRVAVHKLDSERKKIINNNSREHWNRLERQYNLNPELLDRSTKSSAERIFGDGHEGMKKLQSNIVQKDVGSVDPVTGTLNKDEGFYDRKFNEHLSIERMKAKLDSEARARVPSLNVPGAKGAQKALDDINEPTATERLAKSDNDPPDAGLPQQSSGVGVKVNSTAREQEKVPWSVHLEQEDGRIVEVSGDVFESMGHSLATFGRGANLEEATAEGVKRGQAGIHYRGNELNAQLVSDQLMDQHVTIGPENFNRGVQNSLSIDTPSNQAGLATIYDAFQGTMKMLATGLRIPMDFHFANIISAIPMAAIEGVGPLRMLKGMYHTARLLSKDFHALGLDDASTLLHHADTNPRAKRLKVSKVLSADTIHELAALGRRNAGLGRELKGIQAIDEDLLFRDAMGRGWNYPEIMAAMVDNGALSSAVRADQRNILKGDTAVAGIRRRFLESGNIEGAGRRTVAGAQKLAESSELFARISMMHAALDSGYSLDQAAKAVADGMLNYADTTVIEKTILKRGMFFYTYPRKMIPRAIRYMFNNPSKTSMLVNGLLKPGMRGMEEEDTPLNVNLNIMQSEGRPELAIGDYRVNLARLNPSIDALVSLGAMADIIAPGVTDSMREVSGDAAFDRPISPAPLANIAGWQEFFPNEDPLQVNTTWLEEGRRANWVLKLMTGSGPLVGSRDPKVEYSAIEKAAKMVLPYRKVRPGQEAGRRIKRILTHRQEYMRNLKSAEKNGAVAEAQVLQRRIEQMDAQVEDIRTKNPEVDQ